jgi:hypothetical protein
MIANETAEPLSPDEALRLADFARACKAAARVVALYPSSHPAIQSALARVAETAQRLRGEGAASLTVLPDTVLFDGRSAPKPDASLGELAALLHTHLIGGLKLQGDLSAERWHTFLSLLARPPEDIRTEGGIARAWLERGGGAIDLRLIDYAEVLRERSGDADTRWDRLIANYLEGDVSGLDDDGLSELFEIAQNPARLKEFIERLVTRSSEDARREKKEVVLRVLQAIADFAARTHPDQLDRILNQITGAIPRLTPELVVTLITTGVPSTTAGHEPGIDLPGEVRARLSEQTVGEFVARSFSRDHGATARLAEAFQALVPEDERSETLDIAEREAANLPIGKQPEFPNLWKSAADLLTSYSDSTFVSEAYGRELASARAQAVELERVTDDPPERVTAWLSTVKEAQVRRLDQQVLLDLLTLETREDAWRKVLDATLRAIEQLVVAGEFTLAQQLLDRIVAASSNGGGFAESARAALDRLRAESLMQHVVAFLRRAPNSDVEAVSAFCHSLGPAVIKPLAEALATEQGSTVNRLRHLVVSFGAAGHVYANELRSSPNPAVRRTAVELLRAFGGAEALPGLVRLLDDAEPAIQREAARGLVQIGSADAYAALQKALESGDGGRREAIMQALISSRDKRAAPLFARILENDDHRRRREALYLSAIDSLGKIGGDSESVEALKHVLYRGEWWAPRRTERFRAAAAAALRTAGSAAAQQALQEAATHASRGVRRIAQSALTAQTPRPAARKSS